jgi:hypothetical protein
MQKKKKRLQKVVYEEFSLESSLENTYGREAVFVSLARLQVAIRSIRMCFTFFFICFLIKTIFISKKIKNLYNS